MKADIFAGKKTQSQAQVQSLKVKAKAHLKKRHLTTKMNKKRQQSGHIWPFSKDLMIRVLQRPKGVN